ncbi:MAG: LapA family protein [Myxococcota bacterium]|nr:LapA family protein [Myxococcota bacterium]
MAWVRRLIVLAIFVGLLVAGWSLAARNGTTLDVDGIVFRVEGVRLWVVLGTVFIAGAVTAGFLLSVPLARGRLMQRRYRREMHALEAEVHQLRNVPLGMADGADDSLGED